MTAPRRARAGGQCRCGGPVSGDTDPREDFMAQPTALPFDWADPFALDAQLSDEERLVRDTARAYAQDKLQPRVTEAFLDERFDREIMSEMGELGLLGA